MTRREDEEKLRRKAQAILMMRRRDRNVQRGERGGVGGGAAASAFDDVWGWWRADDYSGSSPNIILNDKSGNGRTMTQAAGTLTPGTAGNGQARMVGNSTARLTSSATLRSWPVTVVTVVLRANNATMGLFGHVGASSFSTLWYGFEASNSYRIYNNNSTANTTAEAGSTACYTARIGYGSRVPILNGIVQADQNLANVVRSSALGVSIGTEYRCLNGEWQECLVWDRTLTLTELDEVHAYINTRYGLSIPLWSSYTLAPTICLHGQSNAAGRGDRGASDANVPAEYDAALTGVNVWYGTPVSNIGTQFDTLNINSNNQMLGDTQAATYFGPELTLTKEYIDRVGGSVYLNKYALGATYMNFHSGAGFWIPQTGAEALTQANANRMFAQYMRNWWKAMAVHQAAGRVPDIKAVVQFQGEQDATVEAYANSYATNSVEFWGIFQAEMGYGQDLLKLICRIHINGSETYESTLRDQQALLVTLLQNARLVDTDPYATRPGDGVHLGPQGQLDLGAHLSTLIP